jgi:hypothetical protein
MLCDKREGVRRLHGRKPSREGDDPALERRGVRFPLLLQRSVFLLAVFPAVWARAFVLAAAGFFFVSAGTCQRL